MPFSGKFVLFERKNYEEFAGAAGASPEQVEKTRSLKPATEVEENGDTYTVRRVYPNQTVTNTFTIGQSQEFNFAEGKSAKATASRDGTKLVLKGEKFSQISEIDGDVLKETLTFNGVTMTRSSRRA